MRLIPTLVDPKILTASEVDALVVKLAEACAGGPFVLLYLHGAHARGTQGALSDLDIGALLDPASMTDRGQLDAIAFLQETCGREDVDLVILNRAGPIIRDRVVRHGRLIYARSERDRVRFEAAAIKEAMDFRFFSRQYDDALFRQLREGRFLG
jgi:predicted nucleotidyltransferase